MEYAATLAPSSYLQRVFAWMFAGLLVTAGAAAAIGSSDALLTDITANPLLLIVLFVAQLGLVFAIAARADRMSPAPATGLFLLYSATNGVIFALVFELYTSQSIFTAFAVTAGMFGAMALYGYVTKTDLSKLGSILFMALISTRRGDPARPRLQQRQDRVWRAHPSGHRGARRQGEPGGARGLN